MQNRRRVVGAAVGCAVAIATLLGTPAVSAQDCHLEGCGDPDHGPPPFDKTAPGAPEHAFLKIGGRSNSNPAFKKIPGGDVYPGNTESVFGKHNP